MTRLRPKFGVLSNELYPLMHLGGGLERLAWGWLEAISQVGGVEIITFNFHRSFLSPPEKYPRSFINSPSDLEALARSRGLTHLVLHNRPHWARFTSLPTTVILHNFSDAWTSPADPEPPSGLPQTWGAAQVLCVSQALADHAQTHFESSPSEISVLAPFIDPEFTRRATPLRREGLVFPNRIMEKKGVRNVLDALDVLSFSDPAIRVDFVWNISPNSAPSKEQESLLVEIASRPNARLIPKATRAADVADLYSSYAAALVPSVQPEGFGLVAVEAAALGVAVGCSPLGGLRDLVGTFATELDPTDPKALAQVLRELSTAGRLSEPQREDLAARYSVGASFSSLVERLRQL